MQREYQGIVLFGPPGVGKGAQAAILSKSHGLVHLSTGDLLREEIRQGTPLGRRVKDAVGRGEFADDETVLGIVMNRIDRPEFREGFVMDGFPRNVRQAEMLDSLLGERGTRVSSALFISAPDSVILRRLAGRLVCSGCGATYHAEFKKPKVKDVCEICGAALKRRHDDDPHTHHERLSTYRIQTAPLVEYYQHSGALRKVNGNQTIEGVAAEISRTLDKANTPR